MADAPPHQNPVSQVTQPVNDDRQVEGVKEPSPTSVFVNSEQIREDQVQNAVKFLSHPKVRGSPVMYRRTFLERKGLTKEEIDEAFRRVPDPTPAVATTPPVATNQDGQIKPSSNVQQQPPAQALQPTPVGGNSRIVTLPQFHWYHAILAVGFLAASGAGTALFFKKSIVPRLKSWIRKVVSEEDEEESLMKKNNAKPSAAEEAAAAAKAASAAAADVVRMSQEMLVTKTEERKGFEELINMLNVQVLEMKSMSNSLQRLEGGQNINGRIAVDEMANQRVSRTSSRQPYANGKADTDSFSVRSLSPPAPAPVEPSAAPHPKSYMDILEMIQRGEKPSNIREINDAPPNPSQPLSNPRVAPRPKPWELAQSQNSSANSFPTQDNSNGSNYSYPDNRLNVEDSATWWQQKNVRITEIESGDDQKFGSSSMSRPIQRSSWVPPRPPPVLNPEAAAAIRQPKKASYQTEQFTDDQLLSRSTEVTDELQRITKISESGGPSEATGEGSVFNPPEITPEGNGSYVEAQV